MPDHAGLQDLLMSRLGEAPKPITRDQVLDIAQDALQGYPVELNGFAAWLEKNEAYLLTRLNE